MARTKKTREYSAWQHAKERCSNPNYAKYDRYGGRGITMDPTWAISFTTFLRDMGPCPPGLTLNRINNDGNYEPGNCNWITHKEQQQNKSLPRAYPRKRRAPLVEHNGQTLTIAEWEQLLGMRFGTIRQRLKTGWPIHVALSIPLRSPSSIPRRVV